MNEESLKEKIRELTKDLEDSKIIQLLYLGIIVVCFAVMIIGTIIIYKLKKSKDDSQAGDCLVGDKTTNKVELNNICKSNYQRSKIELLDRKDIMQYGNNIQTPEITLDAVSDEASEDIVEKSSIKQIGTPLSVLRKEMLSLNTPIVRSKYISTDTLKSVAIESDCEEHKQFANIYDEIVKEKQTNGLDCENKESIEQDESQFENLFLEIK